MSAYEKRLIHLDQAGSRDHLARLRWDAPVPRPFPGLEPMRGELMLRVTDRCIFPSSGLFGLLHNMEIKYLVVAGRRTVGSIGLSAIAAASRSFVVTLADGACDNDGQREGHLFVFRQFDQWRGRVRTVDQLVQEFKAAPGTAAGS